MNSQPFDPFEPFDDAAETEPSISVNPNQFFDRAGVAWIVVCAAIAAAAGHWIPPLTEPGIWYGVVQASGPSKPGSGTLEPARAEKAPPMKMAGEEGRPAKPVGKLQLGMF